MENTSIENEHGFIYQLEDFPPLPHLIIYGMQWTLLLAPSILMVSGLVAVALGLGQHDKILLFQNMLFISGAGIIIQTLFGHKLPLQDGPAMALLLCVLTLSPLGIGVIKLGMITGGVALALIALTPFTTWLQKKFTPNVTGSVLLLIVFTLLPYLVPPIAGIDKANPSGSPSVMAFSFTIIILIAVLSFRLKGFLKSIVLILGIFAGTVWFALNGEISFFSLINAAWFSLPLPPPSKPISFCAPVILTFLFAYLAVMVNTSGSINGIQAIVGGNDDGKRLRSGFFINGIEGITAGLCGNVGLVTYSASPGIVMASKVASRFPQTACGAILICASFCPKFSALLSSIPMPVIAATMAAAMASQMGAAIQVIFTKQTRLSSRDYFVIGIPVLLGAIITLVPQGFFELVPTYLRALLSNGLVVGIIVVLFLEHVAMPLKSFENKIKK